MARAYAPRMAPDERRDQLLEAALRMIAEEGYGSVTIEALARSVGVTRPVVYGVFENLGDLLATLLDRYEQRTMDQITAVMEAEASGPGELVRAATRGSLEAIARHPDPWRAILRADDTAAPREVRRRYWEGRERVRALFQQRLEESLGDAAGLCDTEVIAEAVIALSVRAAALVLEDPERYPPERLAGMVEGIAASLEAPALAT